MPNQFRNLVFEGGGVKGIAYAGAIEVLEEKGLLPDIVRVAGTSAGAITAAVLALGADGRTVRTILSETNFREFMDDSFGFFRDAKRLLTEYGWYKGKEFEEWMRRQIRALSGKADLTFGELDRMVRAGGGRYRLLYMVGTDLTTQDCRYYSHEHTPTMPIWKAVRISMSIPLFFKAVVENGKVLVDGALTYNYPIDLFDDKKYVPNPKARIAVNYPTRYGPGHVYNKETLGFRVDTKDEIRAEKLHWKLPPVKIENFGDYARALIGFVSDMANKAHLHTNDWHRTVFIDAKGVGTTDFELPAEKIRMLLKCGREGTRDYFRWFESPAPGEPAPLNRIG